MIDRLLDIGEHGVRYIKKHPQLLMTFILVIIIPIAFLVSGQQFLKVSLNNQETLELDRIGILNDVFASYLKGVSFDPESAQKEIEKIVQLNGDITSFIITRREMNGTSTIIAASNKELIGTEPVDIEPYKYARLTPNQPFTVPFALNGVRYWQSIQLVPSITDYEYYIYTEISLEDIDNLFADRVLSAYFWLFVIICIVLGLLIRQVRLIDYAYLYRETKKANEMKDLFTNMIAHELRAPLTAMRGYANMISERKEADTESKRYAENIQSAAERLLLIVNDLLDVARIQSGKLKVEKEPVDLSRVVSAVIEEMRGVAEGKNITLGAEGVHADIIIKGDAKRLHQALTNLVSNAIKYTERGSINVSLEKRRDRVELRVKDTGMGIASENQQKLFAPFFRVESEAVNAITGTGLGMWITKQLIELMSASIGVESIKGIGTHVVVTFPVEG